MEVHRRLRAQPDTAGLLAEAGASVRGACRFDRALVATVADGMVSARESGVLADPASDKLRRRLVAQPVVLHHGTEEAERARRPSPAHGARRPSRLAEALELEDYAFAAVAPEGVCLALVVADRAAPEVTERDHRLLEAFALVLGVAVERMVLQRRVGDLAEEVRQFAGVAQAMAREVREAPLSLRDGTVGGVTLARAGVPGHEIDGLSSLLTAQERRVAALLIEGRSNPEIAATLVLSRETVKTHVAHILRKVGAANRVEAAARLLPHLGGR